MVQRHDDSDSDSDPEPGPDGLIFLPIHRHNPPSAFAMTLELEVSHFDGMRCLKLTPSCFM
jgi:hypothetical protein